ncbi:MAG: low molecular weight phosphotyrosine protein phosphatase [Chlamydiales bacterium]|nr:low molecular weight phosphotyrosine protein phosphatase [Chlamydiales bacterium]
MSKKTISVLFVCVGNICRSPALKGMMEHLLKERGIHADIESCGLHATFLGNPPDRRMVEGASKRGITLENRAKMFEASYFDRFDAIFCVTHDVQKAIQAMAHTPAHQKKIYLATAFSEKFKGEEIPDPYFGGEKGFDHAWEMIEESCQGILKALDSLT